MGGVEITDLARTFDLWFDNIFTDWSVQGRIAEAAGRVRTALAGVSRVGSRLLDRQHELEALLATLTRAREELIIGR